MRRDGQLAPASEAGLRMIDFDRSPVRAMRLTWGDIFMAYYSTGIPNIEDYTVFSEKLSQQMNAINK